jgi:hypothetical protein
MKRHTLNSLLPLVKEYAAGRGKGDQRFKSSDSQYGNAVAALVRGSPLHIVHQKYGTTYCFNILGSWFNSYDAPQAIFMQIQPRPDDLDEEAYRHYIQWVLNYSPWRHIFVTKSINQALKKGVVIIDPSFPKNTVMDGMIALRQAWDNYYNQSRYQQIGLWWELIQKVNPLPAFAIISNLLYLKSGDQVAKGIVHSGHSPIGIGGSYITSLDNVVRGNLIDTSNPFNEERFPEAWEVWNHGGKPSKLPKLVSEALEGMGKGKEKVNPFKISDTAGIYNRKDVIDCLINEIPNMEKEIGV